MFSQPTYVFGDIHGCANELIQLLGELPLTPESQLVFLGDYVDRGPDSKKVIDTIIDLKSKYKVKALKGNHEDMFLSFLAQPESPQAALFILNGGSATLASYSESKGSFNVPPDHIEFLMSLELMHDDDQYVYVHAGLPLLPLDQINPQLYRDDLMWIRQPFLSTDFDWGKTVVHGHTPRDEVTIRPNRINLDTGCVFGGQLTSMELPKKKVFQVRKSGPAPHTYLQDDHSKRIAYRFSGAIRVRLEDKDAASDFLTLNYNEFGMLLRANDENTSPELKVGDLISGTIGPDMDKKLFFSGVVMRVDARGPFKMFGIRMDNLESSKEKLIEKMKENPGE